MQATAPAAGPARPALPAYAGEGALALVLVLGYFLLRNLIERVQDASPAAREFYARHWPELVGPQPLSGAGSDAFARAQTRHLIDFTEELIGASFKIRNPNATAACGCGTSFSV